MPAKAIDIGVWLGYAVSAVTALLGIVILAGFMMPGRVPGQFRYTFGIILVLMGIYRFVLTRTKVRQARDEDREES